MSIIYMSMVNHAGVDEYKDPWEPVAEEGSHFRGANWLRRKIFYGEKLKSYGELLKLGGLAS